MSSQLTKENLLILIASLKNYKKKAGENLQLVRPKTKGWSKRTQANHATKEAEAERKVGHNLKTQ